MSISVLVDRYFEQIILEDAIVCDIATLDLLVPKAMLLEYSKNHGQKTLDGETIYPPNGVEFWKNTSLHQRLHSSGKKPPRIFDQTDFEDVLEYLEDQVTVEFQELTHPEGYVKMTIYEIPIYYG